MAGETKWTPGPWEFDKRSISVWSSDEDRIAVLVVGGDKPRAEEDGRLIAAAPDLYAALVSLREVASRTALYRDCAEVAACVEAALSRARGEQP